MAVTLLTSNELNGFQAIIRNGGKENVDEIKVIDNAEESRAKEYAKALERMQSALKHEKQLQMTKQIYEKNKSAVSVNIFQSTSPVNDIII